MVAEKSNLTFLHNFNMKNRNSSTVQEIRSKSDQLSACRRDIARWSAVGLLDFVPISLYQLGVIRHLPDLPGDLFDSDYVNASKDAQVVNIPDAPVSLLLYATNLLLASVAMKKKKVTIIDYLLAANSLGQAVGGGVYLYKMAAKQKKVCLYCVAGALINFTSLPPVFKLLRQGQRQ